MEKPYFLMESTELILGVQLPAGFEICEEGDLADCFYILHDGEVNARSFSNPALDTQLKAPGLLGQVALLQEQDPKYVQRQCGYRQSPIPSTPCLILPHMAHHPCLSCFPVHNLYMLCPLHAFHLPLSCYAAWQLFAICLVRPSQKTPVDEKQHTTT